MKRLSLCIGALLPLLGLLPPEGGRVFAEDIDIYVQAPDEDTAGSPNVLIVLDNTANWNDNAQHWPGGITQGQSEIRAIAKVLHALPVNSVNVGLLMNSNAVGGSGTGPGGYMRFAIRPLTAEVKAAWLEMLGMTVTNGVVTPITNCAVTANSLNGTPNCMYQNAQQSINSSGEQGASSAEYARSMFEAFKYYGGFAAPDGTHEPQDATHFGPYRFADNPGALGSIPRLDAGAFDDWNSTTKTGSRYDPPSSSGCANNYVIFIGNGLPSQDSATISTNMVSAVHFDAAQLPWQNYTPSSVSHTDSCFAQTNCKTGACGSGDFPAACSDGTYSSCACGTASTAGCSIQTTTDSCIASTPCRSGSGSCSGADFPASCGDGTYSSCACSTTPTSCTYTATTTCFYTTPCDSNCASNDFPSACSNGTYDSCACGTFSHGSCGNGKDNYCINGMKNSSGSRYCIDGTRTVQPQTHCIDGTYTTTTMVPSGVPGTPTGNVAKLYGDEWAHYMYQADVDGTLSGRQPIITYTLNVFNAKPDADQTALLQGMAKFGGGQYYEATSEAQIVFDLTSIFAQIQAVNSVFAASSLPINATNRTQNENQVYIGMFRPDPAAKPRWFGNTKRYQLGYVSGTKIDLVDVNGNPALNTGNEGFVQPCAVSHWTTETSFSSGSTISGYWEGPYPRVSPDPKGDASCVDSTDHSPYSDLPDGPFVEKGAAAEVLRRGNDPTSSDADAAPPWHVTRNVLTLNSAGDALADLSTATALSTSLINFTKGYDLLQEYPGNYFNASTCTGSGATGLGCGSRPSIHGDVVHSRPLAVNYGTSRGVVLFYGANDGTYRAVQAADGKELWAFVAPESYDKLERLKDQSPLIRYPVPDATGSPKDYFWDGSSGIWQVWGANAPDSTYIYPSVRRGGRYLYAFNVTDPSNPAFAWRRSYTDTNMSNLGQTWSSPNLAYVTGFTDPMVIFGGGYDACEDSNYPSTDTDPTHFTCSASGTLGSSVYALNATDGAVVFAANTGGRSVAGDVTLVDMDQDGQVDFGYFADTAGNLYRVNFVDANLATQRNGANSGFSVTRIAYTTGGGRKFLYAPAAMVNNGKVILALGSGDREHPLASQYPYTTPVQNRFYVFIDNPIGDYTPTQAYNLDGSAMRDVSDPANAACDAEAITSEYPTLRGWYLDLCGGTTPCPVTNASDNRGEQTVTSAVIVGGIIFYSTNRPTPNADTDSCASNLGEARGYALNLVTGAGVIGADGLCGGARSGVFLNGGLPPSPVVAHVPVTASDGTTKVVTAVIGGIQVDGSASSVIGAQNLTPAIQSKRKIIYWHTGSD